MKTSPQQTSLFTTETLTSSQAGSPAKTFPSQQTQPLESTNQNQDSGDTCSEPQEKLGHNLSLLKTAIFCSNEDLKNSSMNFPNSGMMRNGNVYKDLNWVSPKEEKGYTLYSTPLASETGYRRGKFSQGGTSLSTQLGGIPTLEFMEWLMGFPIGWTDTER